MLSTVGIIAFILAILFSIAWHELGHFIPAKKFGVKVTQFMIGFGTTLWSRRKGDTEYGVKAIPLGGYVRMIGMFPPAREDSAGSEEEGSQKKGRLAIMVEDARNQAAEEVVTEDDERRTFYRLSVPKKLVVMMGGPVMNLILATVLFAIMFVGFGLPAQSLRVEQVTPCVPTAQHLDGKCGAGSTPSPAAQAGLRAGDVITSFDGRPVSSWSDLTQAIRSTPPGTTISLGVDRDGKPVELTAALAGVPRQAVNGGPDTSGEVTFLGMSPELVLEPQPISAVPERMWELTTVSVRAMLSIPQKMVGVAQAAFGGEERDPAGPVGVVGVTRISGDVAASDDLPTSWKIAQFLGLVASLNLFLFLFNLIPLLPLDGGHVAGAVWEGARRQLARLRHRPDPGPVDVAKALPLAYAIAFLLIGMSVLLMYADVVNPIRLGG
ncbi:MAG: site-2 protease family protein [Candidatus Nanopelagicales bacterium]|nr:site-2 protease family protein [Candidatus Nanopelagicales bacterium]